MNIYSGKLLLKGAQNCAFLTIFALSSITLFSACNKKSNDPAAPPPPKENPTPPKENPKNPEKLYSKAIVETAIDKAANPCVDFYQYACGGWQDKYVLPAEKSAYFMKGSSIADGAVVEMIENLKKEKEAATPLGKLYEMCLNRGTNAVQNLAEIKSLVSEVDKVTDIKAAVVLIGKLHSKNISALFSAGAGASFQNSQLNIIHLAQDPYSLPEKDYYLSKEEKLVKTRAEYLNNISKMLGTAGVLSANEEASQTAEKILKFETVLAENALPKSEAWNPSIINNPTDFAGVKSKYNWDWDLYLKELGVAGPEKVPWNVTALKYFDFLFPFLAKDMDSLRLYLKWKIVLALAPQAGGEIESQNFAFWSAYLNGVKAPTAIEKSCLKKLESLAPDNLSMMYVKRHPEAAEAKKSGINLVQRIKDAFVENLKEVNWLNDDTKLKVREKINKLLSLIAYGDEGVYQEFDLTKFTSATSFIQAYNGLMELQVVKSNDQIGKSVNKKKWGMQPYEDNAYYSREENKMVLPYTNWVAPYYDVNGSDAANLGSISYIAHEIIHGFDAEGSSYDQDGNLSGWWSEKEKQNFKTLNQCYINQANAYKIKQGWFVKGEQTIDENIADQAGIILNYKAYLANKEKAKSISGDFTPEQQFFIAYAQSWCAKETDERIYTIVNSDGHPPVEYRVNGVVMNMGAFAKAFSCSSGTPMNPVNKCRTW